MQNREIPWSKAKSIFASDKSVRFPIQGTSVSTFFNIMMYTNHT